MIVKRIRGFTLIEWLLVIVLMGIIGATAAPLFLRHDDFEEKFFLDELSNMLRYARKVATATGCDVQIRYSAPNVLALYQRKNCTTDDFSKLVPSPFLLAEPANMMVEIPKGVSVKGNFPFYINKDGKVYNQFHLQPKEIILQLNKRQLIIDGFSGLVYEKRML